MRSQRLRVGDKVPGFWTRDINEQIIDSKHLGQYTLLAFLRYAGCPFCNLAVYRLAHEYPQLKKHGCDIVAFVQSTEGNIRKNIIGRHSPKPPFAIVSDIEQDFYSMFGVQASVLKTVKHTITHAANWMDSAFSKGFKQANIDGNGFMVPAMFLVNTEGAILLADYDADFYSDETFIKIYSQLTNQP